MKNPLKELGAKRFSKSLYLCENPKYSMYSIGKFSYCDGKLTVLKGEENATLKIGNFCSIAAGVIILLGGEHRTDWVTTFPFSVLFEEFKGIKGHPSTKGDVTIGNDVWVGINTLILSGVSIGDGAVIGASSVVANDVPPYTVVAGNPARLIRRRFDDETIKKLLEMKWWNWDIQKIKDNMPLLLSNHIAEFIEKNRTTDS